jgi:hypothetical protein
VNLAGSIVGLYGGRLFVGLGDGDASGGDVVAPGPGGVGLSTSFAPLELHADSATAVTVRARRYRCFICSSFWWTGGRLPVAR